MMKNLMNLNSIFRDEFQEGDSGNGDDSSNSQSDQNQEGGENEGSGEGEQQQQQQEQTTGVSADQMQQLLVAAKGAPQQQQQQQAPQLQVGSPEYNKAFNVVSVTEALAQQLGLAEGQHEAFDGLLQGVVRQTLTMAQKMMEAQRNDFQAQLQPAMQIVQQQKEETLWKDFSGKNKDLANFRPLVKSVAQQLQAEGVQGTPEQLFALVAERTRTMLTGLNIDTNKQNNSNQSSNANNGGNRMSTTGTNGGQGGAGGGQGQTQSQAKAIFG
ncbi:MAG: hypothetical protein COA57_14855 [Flavobacteriales bacterium]|nr:MAG: hypothetical protein COA57_14855 [Flavobacteriales bacterium]